MLLSKIIQTCKDELEIANFKDYNIQGIQTDSRLIKKNNIFFALDGRSVKGINFVDSAINNGAVVVVCSSKENYTNNNIVVIKCDDVINILGKCLQVFYNPLPTHIVGITGTSGKTSVAEFTRQAIQKLGIDSASIGTLGVNFKNSHLKEDTLTMRETVDLYEKLHYLKAEKNIEYVAMEFTSQGLHQRRAVGIKAEIGLFNNITPEHLDYHITMDDYLNQKLKLFTEVLNDNSIAIINADIPEYEKIKSVCNAHNHNILTYGFNGDVKIINIETHLQGQNITFQYNNQEYTIKTPFIGKFQAMNLLATFSILVSLDIEKSIDKIVSVLENIKQAEGRMELVGVKDNGATIYIDFAHKPDALKQVLETMKDHISHDKEARIGILFGCGGDRDKTKRPIMGKIANDLADFVIITDDNPRTENADIIRSEIVATCPNALNIADRKIAIEKAIDLLKPKDILILAGKGHEKYTIIGKELLPFDEFKIVKDYLKKDK